jgi:putative MATE family efflux protein
MPEGKPVRAAGGFTSGSVPRHLVRLGSYMAMGSVTMNVAQLAEAVYLGMVGTEALAAMGFAFPLTIVLFAFAGGIGTGASSVIARAAGAGERETMRRLVTHAQLLAVVVGVLLAIGGVFAADWMVAALGAEGEVREMTVRYLKVYMFGVPFFLLGIVGSTLLRATGSAASPGIVMTAGSLMQIAFGPLLIFGLFGFPELGIAGAALAYVLSRAFSVVLYLGLLVRAKMYEWSFEDFIGSWKAILHVGGPAIMSGLIHPVSMLVMTRLLAGHGHEVVAGFNVATRVETMAHMILWSASSSAEPFIGQNWGANRVDRVRSALSVVYRFCLAWGAFTFIVMSLVGALMVSLIDDNLVVREVAQGFFLIIPLTIGMMGVMQVANSSFNARGMPMPPLIMTLVRTFAFYIPLCYLGDYLFGYMGIFLASGLVNVVAGGVAWYWNRRSIERHGAGFGAEQGAGQGGEVRPA